MKKLLHNTKENLIYLIIWLLFFTAPVVSMYIRSTHHSDIDFSWTQILHVWQIYLVFLVIFLVHNFLIAPLLIYKGNKKMYFTALACVMVLFITYECTTKPARPDHPQRPPMEQKMEQKMAATDSIGMNPQDGKKPEFRPDRRHMPPLMFGERDIIDTVIMFLLLAMNLGVKLYFKNERDKKQLAQLKTENLEQQLAYLKYQINPHFFMNTLNNIHALVDIDPEKAKESIIVLSKMMRYILYEGNNTTIPLQREVDFIEHYVQLMRMRYTDNVTIETHLPQNLQEGTVPPLLFISFVENAFKHGITYNKPSFIHISVDTTDGHIIFACKNSKKEGDYSGLEGWGGSKASPSGGRLEGASEGGVGLANVQKRLALIYKDDYQLDINDGADTYEVTLTLPAVLLRVES